MAIGKGIASALERLASEARFSAPLLGAPIEAAIPKAGMTLSTLPDPRLRALSHLYRKEMGIDHVEPSVWSPMGMSDATRVARAFDAMPDTPGDPLVSRAYQDAARETLDQLDALTSAGYKFEFMPRDKSGGFIDPYAASPRLALEDLRQNKRMFVFPTEGGYGTLNEASLEAPFLRPVRGSSAFGGSPFVVNDAFRAVHDALGHGPIGAGFRRHGEDMAFQHHASMFKSDPAFMALAGETRGQNSWVNALDRAAPGTGGKTVAEYNKMASGADTIYADQKAGVLPDWVYNLRVADDPMQGGPIRRRPVDINALRAALASGAGSGGVLSALLAATMPARRDDGEIATAFAEA